MQVYARPAGSYVMDQLELRRVAYFPISVAERSDTVILIANFGVSPGLRMAEATLLNQQVCMLMTCSMHIDKLVCFCFYFYF